MSVHFLPDASLELAKVRARRGRLVDMVTSKTALVAIAMSTLASPVGAAPLTAGFDKLPFPAERNGQAKLIRSLLEAADRSDEARFKSTLEAGATLKLDTGAEARLDLRGFQRLLAGCAQVSDFAIPHDKDKLGIVWQCGTGRRAARFQIVDGRIAAVHASTNYVVYAPPPPPPPPPPLTAAQRDEMRSRNAVTAIVRDHFILLARRDSAELAAFLPKIASIPVYSEGGPTTLGEFYRRELLLEDGREVRVRGCGPAADFDRSSRVDCRLHISRATPDAQLAHTNYNLGYVIKAKSIQSMSVTALPMAEAGN